MDKMGRRESALPSSTTPPPKSAWLDSESGRAGDFVGSNPAGIRAEERVDCWKNRVDFQGCLSSFGLRADQSSYVQRFSSRVFADGSEDCRVYLRRLFPQCDCSVCSS